MWNLCNMSTNSWTWQYKCDACYFHTFNMLLILFFTLFEKTEQEREKQKTSFCLSSSILRIHFACIYASRIQWHIVYSGVNILVVYMSAERMDAIFWPVSQWMFSAFVCWNILSSHGLHGIATAGVVNVTNAGTACSLNIEQSKVFVQK